MTTTIIPITHSIAKMPAPSLLKYVLRNFFIQVSFLIVQIYQNYRPAGLKKLKNPLLVLCGWA
jgi:hypothetical protein